METTQTSETPMPPHPRKIVGSRPPEKRARTAPAPQMLLRGRRKNGGKSATPHCLRPRPATRPHRRIAETARRRHDAPQGACTVIETLAEHQTTLTLNTEHVWRNGDRVAVSPKCQFLSETGVVIDADRYDSFILIKSASGSRWYAKENVTPLD